MALPTRPPPSPPPASQSTVADTDFIKLRRRRPSPSSASSSQHPTDWPPPCLGAGPVNHGMEPLEPDGAPRGQNGSTEQDFRGSIPGAASLHPVWDGSAWSWSSFLEPSQRGPSFPAVRSARLEGHVHVLKQSYYT
jgi:hypothetical protein